MIAHQHPRVHPSAGPFTRLSQMFGKKGAYRLHRGKCALVDSHWPSRGKTRRHIRSEPLVPQLTFLSMPSACQDLLTDSYSFLFLFFFLLYFLRSPAHAIITVMLHSRHAHRLVWPGNRCQFGFGYVSPFDVRHLACHETHVKITKRVIARCPVRR